MSIIRNPLVSIVIPSLQQSKFIRTALESILAQNYSPIEIIVQDNLSSDGTSLILNEYRDKVQNIFIERDNGQSDALNKGFRRSKGEILGWLNADDMLMPNAIQKVVKAFQSRQRPHIVYGHCANLDEFGQFLNYFNIIIPFSIELFVNAPNLLAQPSTFFLRKCYFEAGGLNPNLEYAMDWDLWCKFAKMKYQFCFIDEVLSGARIYPDTKSMKGGWRRLVELYFVNMAHKSHCLPIATIIYLYFDSIKPRFQRIRILLNRLINIFCLNDNNYIKSFCKNTNFLQNDKSSEYIIKFPFYGAIIAVRATIFLQHENTGTSIERATFNNIISNIKCQSSNKVNVIWTFKSPTYFSSINLNFIMNNKTDRERIKISVEVERSITKKSYL